MKGTVEEGIRYTTLLPKSSLAELKRLVSRKEIESVNSGIRYAVESFLREKSRMEYDENLAKAARDKRFQARNEEVERDFEALDREGPEGW